MRYLIRQSLKRILHPFAKFLSIESGVGETKLKHSFSNPFFTWAEFSRHGKNPSNEVDMEENIKHAIFPS